MTNFYVLLTVHLGIILDNDQLDTHLLYFTIRLLNSLLVSSIICSSSGGRIVLMQHLVSYYENKLFSEDDNRCCINTIHPPDDKHIMLETCRGFNKRIVK